jgi:hypothetical protein
MRFGTFDYDFQPRGLSAAPLTIRGLAGCGIRGCCFTWNLLCSGSHIRLKSAFAGQAANGGRR